MNSEETRERSLIPLFDLHVASGVWVFAADKLEEDFGNSVLAAAWRQGLHLVEQLSEEELRDSDSVAGSGNGSGRGTGNGYGHGSGHGGGTGNGKGSGTGSGNGNGYGTGHGSGTGNGRGNGDGTGDG